MAEFAEAASFSEEEEENIEVRRVFTRREDSCSPSASDDGEYRISEFERKKSSSKAKLRALASKSVKVPVPVAKTQKSKDEEIQESLKQLNSQGKYVKLNVGGSLFYTTIGTLTKHDNMLRAMFSGRIPLVTDEEGRSFFLIYRVSMMNS